MSEHLEEHDWFHPEISDPNLPNHLQSARKVTAEWMQCRQCGAVMTKGKVWSSRQWNGSGKLERDERPDLGCDMNLVAEVLES